MRTETYPEIGDRVVVRTGTFIAEGRVVAVQERIGEYDVQLSTHIAPFRREEIMMYLGSE